MSLGINSSLAGPAINSLEQYGLKLQTLYAQASSGNLLTSAAVDPSGLAIYNALTTQAQGFDQATENVSDAGNAINVAQGALSGTQDALQQLNSLAVEANNGLLTASDTQAIQDQANQLVQQINTNASQVNFNGTTLLTGQFSGTTPATPAGATIPSNGLLAAGGNVVTSANAAPAAQAGTIGVSVVDAGGGAAGAQFTFTDSVTGQVTNIGGVAAANSTTVINGTSVTVGNLTSNDIGTTATIQVQGAQAGSSNATLNVQSGANAGVSVQVNLPNGTSSGLFLRNIDLSTPANATNAQGQIQAALSQVATAQATLGAQTNSLQFDQSNDQLTSLNLTASASSIGDVNYASLSTEINSLNIQNQVSIDTLNSANADLGYLNRFFNVAA
jgi:flagellin